MPRFKFNTTIKGRESRSCEFEGCEWKENQDNSERYGVYMPGGKYYCPKHGYEEERLTD